MPTLGMQSWAVPALFAMGCIGAHYLALRAASGRIGDMLGALVLEGAAVVGIVVLMWLTPSSGVATTQAGLFWSAVSGLCITGASILLFMTLRMGGPVSSTGTIVLGGGVVIGALLAPLLFGEALTGRRLLGVALGAAAIVILATEKPQ